MNPTAINPIKIKVGSGQGSVPPGNKSIPEILLSKFHDAIWCHQGTTELTHKSLYKLSFFQATFSIFVTYAFSWNGYFDTTITTAYHRWCNAQKVSRVAGKTLARNRQQAVSKPNDDIFRWYRYASLSLMLIWLKLTLYYTYHLIRNDRRKRRTQSLGDSFENAFIGMVFIKIRISCHFVHVEAQAIIWYCFLRFRRTISKSIHHDISPHSLHLN